MNLLNRREIAPGVFISSVTDPRFKQNRVSVCFMTQHTKETAAAKAVLPKILTNSCRVYPDLQLLNVRLSELYAARLSANSLPMGDTQCMSFSVSAIDDRYALAGEPVLSESIKVLLSCLFDPLTEGEAFSAEVTETEKQTTIDQIESELNDKRLYAARRASELLCAGEPAAFGNPEIAGEYGVESVTPESAYSVYRAMLETARIEIFCGGCNDFTAAREILAAEFAKLKRGAMDDCHSKRSPLKPEPVAKEEVMDVNQSKMVIGFKVKEDIADIPALNMAVKIYGGTTTSKLFTNVREKMSLCYYCWAAFNDLKGLVTAECGVEKDKIGQAKDEIRRQLELVQSGDFTDDELLHAKLDMEDSLKSLNDRLSGLESWYVSRIYRCDIITPEQAAQRYNEVTRERVIAAVRSAELDSVYLLTSGESESEKS